MALAMSAVLAMSGEFWGPLGCPQQWMHTLRSVHNRSCSLGANENSCDRAVGCPSSCMLQRLALSSRQVLGASWRSPANDAHSKECASLFSFTGSKREQLWQGCWLPMQLHAAVAALPCRLVPQLSFQWLGLAALPGCHSEWRWLLRGSAMWQLQCTPQAEVSGDHLQVPQVRCMPHGACSTLPPWQEGEGPHVRSWCVGGNPSRLNSCWGLGPPLTVRCVQRRLCKRLQGQADRVAWCLANSGGLLMVPRGWMHAPWSVCHHFHSLVLNLAGRVAPQTTHKQGWGIGRCGCALEGHHYSQAMAFGPPAAQPVIFVQVVPHLLGG